MTDRLTDARLAAIRERLAAATPGPWEARVEVHGVSLVPLLTNKGHLAFAYGDGWGDDAEFIAHAPTDVAALLAEVERLRAELENADG